MQHINDDAAHKESCQTVTIVVVCGSIFIFIFRGFFFFQCA